MIPLFKVFMSEDVLKPVSDVLMSGFVTQGPKVEEFETLLKPYLDNEYLLTLNSATSGLTLALRLLKNASDSWPGLNEDDIILSPALTCFATSSAILANNMKIGWLDSDLRTCNVDLTDLETKLNEKTKVIYVVHWGGTPINWTRLEQIRENYRVQYGFLPMIIEDCAHAFGTEYDNIKLGSSKRNSICVFSLQAIKHLTTCDGGIITLPNEELYERAKLLRWFGIDRDKRNYKGKDLRMENNIVESGYKFHMNDLNATIGIYNFPHIPRLLEIDRNCAKYYNEHLQGINGVTLLNFCGNSAFWLYSLRVARKADLMDFLKEHGIMTSQVHNRNDINTCVKDFQCHLPNIDILETDLICIPNGWWVTDENMEFIVSKIREFYA